MRNKNLLSMYENPSYILQREEELKDLSKRQRQKFSREDVMPEEVKQLIIVQADKNARTIQSAVRNKKARKEIADVRKTIQGQRQKMIDEILNDIIETSVSKAEEEQRLNELEEVLLENLSLKKREMSGLTALSGASTPRQQQEIQELEEQIKKVRKERSDKGFLRKERRPVGRPTKEESERIKAEREAKQAKKEAKKQAKEGRGIRAKKLIKRKTTIGKDDKKKNRLRLIISQIEAGNNNPRLIIELNKLYKDLYGIDNAIMLIKRT